MELTVADILNYPEFSGFELIAGKNGIFNAVTTCGILDYEYDPTLKRKYTDLSFIPHQLILSSLQYAKDDPNCLIDAVRLLHRHKCSGLVIKNVYSLHIPSHVLHFADNAGFPIILLKSSEQYFERIIINVYKRLQSLHDFDYFEYLVNRILTLPEHDLEQKKLQLEVNPCLQPDIFCMYFRSSSSISLQTYTDVETRVLNAGLLTSYNTLLRYKKGLLFIHSANNFKGASANELAKAILAGPLGYLAGTYYIGVSAIHYRERKIKLCIAEAIYSSYFHFNSSQPYQTYETLGVHTILLPWCREPAMQRFATAILSPIRDCDTENHTALMKTVKTFVACNGQIAPTAAQLGQHKNTIRYRLNQISQLLSFNILQPEGYEKISLALKIEYCSRIEL